jgi:hypothetical protein
LHLADLVTNNVIVKDPLQEKEIEKEKEKMAAEKKKASGNQGTRTLIRAYFIHTRGSWHSRCCKSHLYWKHN